MNSRAMTILAAFSLVIVAAMPLADPLTKLMPLSIYAKEYYSTAELTATLQNECSPEDGIANCANNNAETLGDKNIIDPQISQTSPTKTGRDGPPGPPGEQGIQGPPGETGATGPPGSPTSSDLIHVVWHDDIPGNFDTLYKRYGADFDPSTMILSDSPVDGFNAAIAVSGNNVHVGWHDGSAGNFDILYRRSTDGGANFVEPIKNLSDNPDGSFSPAIAASGNNVYVVWQDFSPGDNDILYTRSVDSGNTFPEEIMNLSDSSGFSDVPAVASIEDNVYVVWSDDTSGNHEILYRKSLDNGATFDPTLSNLSTNGAVSHAPAVAVS